MDTVGMYSIIIIAGLFVLIIILNVVFKKLKIKKAFRLLSELAKKSGFEISDFYTYRIFSFGIDNNKKHVFLYNSDKKEFTDIDLNNVKKCSVNHNIRTIRQDGASVSVTDKIEIVFENPDKTIANTYFEFYNAEYSGHLSDELKTAEVWSEKIMMMLNKNKSK